jgi:hypothetical protein
MMFVSYPRDSVLQREASDSAVSIFFVCNVNSAALLRIAPSPPGGGIHPDLPEGCGSGDLRAQFMPTVVTPITPFLSLPFQGILPARKAGLAPLAGMSAPARGAK